jgi:Zn-dependent peptidase ImmA (M78 family)/transcriptional regulator with XRE-family HTH domain
MAQKAKINPEILKWARKTSKLSLEKAASTISKTCKVDKIKEWESPECKDFPTVKQVEKLARLYRRPADIFYLPFIPKDFPALKDFRRNKEDGLNTALIFMMREVQEKQEWLSKFLMKNREKKLEFAGKYNIKSSVEVVAADIRKTLGIKQKEAAEKPLKYWVTKAENKRIFISLSSNYHTRLKLDSDFFKGFVIADKYAPFIFLNSDDWDQGQLFTLVHELAHIWIGVSGISNETDINASASPGIHQVEKFCNEVAIKALLPEEEVVALLPKPNEITFKNISRASKKLGVSNNALIHRLLNIGVLTEDNFKLFRKEADNTWKDFLEKEASKKKSSGGPNYYVMQLRRSSKAFANIVMDIYKSGKVNGSDASRLLKVKEGNFVKFEKYIYK